METGYYLCKVRTINLLHKQVYEARILYWDNKWLDKEGSFFVTKDEDVKQAIKIPDNFYQVITS